MVTITTCGQHGDERKCIITPRGEHLSLDPVRCRQHGEGPWCRELGQGEHQPVRPVLQAVLEEVNRRIPRYPRGQQLAIRHYGQHGEHNALEVVLGGNDPERERARTDRAIRHVLREWFPRTLELHGETETASRARQAASAGDMEFLMNIWKDTQDTPAISAVMAAFNIAGGDRLRSSPQGPRQASRRDFVGREIGNMAEAMLEAHQAAGLELDLREELRGLLCVMMGES